VEMQMVNHADSHLDIMVLFTINALMKMFKILIIKNGVVQTMTQMLRLNGEIVLVRKGLYNLGILL
jgi:hypothetical protein